jgi:hypothetical protein
MRIPVKLPAAGGEHEAYDALCAYTLQRGDAEFIHQHVADAHTAQRAGEGTRPMALAFALLGLYLHVEKGWTGRQVQRAHMSLARGRREWPRLLLPRERGVVTAADVVRAPGGAERDRAIHAWCRSVWGSFAENRGAIEELLRKRGIL